MKRKAITLIFTVLILQISFGKVKLPKLLSDGMVLQRDAMVKIWGWAEAREKVTVSFNKSIVTTTADDSGRWGVTLPHLKAGGPYTMMVYAGDTCTIQNILVGDVWICSGQSNMELPMKRVSPLYESEIANSENTNIRCFTVPQKYNFITPQEDLDSGSWQPTTPKTILNFSAVAYFFAKELYAKYHIPIGLIHASLGGSPAQSWMSEEALKMFPEYYKEAQRLKDSSLITKIENEDKVRIQAWYTQLGQKDEGYKDPKNIWYDPSINTSDWPTMKIPGYWATTALGSVNGVVWFRKELDIPAFQNNTGTDSLTAGQQAKLILGRIVDADSVFVNGVFVGTTSYQYPPRRYDFPSSILKEGKNIIAVRVISNSGTGGFVLDKQYELRVGGRTYDLSGDWQVPAWSNDGAISKPDIYSMEAVRVV